MRDQTCRSKETLRRSIHNGDIERSKVQFDGAHLTAGTRRAFLRTACATAALVSLPSCRCSTEPDEVVVKAPKEEPPAPPPKPGFTPPAHEPNVRVRIYEARDGNNTNSPVLGRDLQWVQITSDDDRHGRSAVLRGPMRLSRFGEQWSLADDFGSARAFTGQTITALNPGFDESTISLNDRPYGGLFRFIPRSDIDERAFDIVNELPMEQYLPGVLARELYRHWELAAFEAQAVAARSFACQEVLHYSTRRHFDLTDTQQSQAYIGLVDFNKAHEAVQKTAGQVLGYHGMLVPGYYCSCCGGCAAPADVAIGDNPVNLLPPLAGRVEKDVCQDAPLYDWSITRDRSDAARRIAAFAKQMNMRELFDLETIQDIECIMSAPGGRPLRYQITGANGGGVEISAERLRSALNHRPADLPEYNKSLPSSFVNARVEGDALILDGHGFGHGVGMCQYGAQALAKQSTGYLDILRWYYPGVEIVHAYETARQTPAIVG